MFGYLLSASSASSGAIGATGETGSTDYTVLFSIIGLLICIALPTATVLIGTLKHRGKIRQIFWGLLGFVVFSGLLYSLVSNLILPGYQDQTATDFEAMVLIVVRVVCEVIGMFLLLLFTRKKRDIGNAFDFAAGYCLAECFIIGFLLVGYLLVATSDDISHIDAVRELRIYVQKNNLVEGEEWRFILRGFTAIVFCCLQVASCVLTYIGVQTKKYWYAIGAIAFGLLIRLPNRMHTFDSWLWGNYAVIIPYLAIMAVIINVIAYAFYRKNKDEMPGEEALPDPKRSESKENV